MHWGERLFALRGSVDLERIVSRVETTTTVLGERLSAEVTAQSLLVGMNGGYRHNRVTVGAPLAARQELGSTDTEYMGFLNLGIRY